LGGGKCQCWSRPATRWSARDDATAATVAALAHGGPGIYNVVEEEPAPALSRLPDLAEAIEAKPPRRIPVWLGRLVAGEPVVLMMTETRGSSNAKAKRELRWQPRYPSWRDGFRHNIVDDDPAPIAEWLPAS
jgi:nucleoside-diphosphate-sugar epimerase